MDAVIRFLHSLHDPQALIQLVIAGGYFVLAAIVFAETGLLIGFFLPGDSLLVTAGLVAAAGHLDIVALNVLLVAMAIAGDATGYYIGKRTGPMIFTRAESRFFKREHLLKTKAFYDKHGGKTIIIARFMPFIRTFAPVVAGVAEMGYRRFAVFNVIGGAGWVTSMTLLGYFLGTFELTLGGRRIVFRDHVEKIVIVVIFLSILPGIIAFAREKLRRRDKAAAAPADVQAAEPPSE